MGGGPGFGILRGTEVEVATHLVEEARARRVELVLVSWLPVEDIHAWRTVPHGEWYVSEGVYRRVERMATPAEPDKWTGLRLQE